MLITAIRANVVGGRFTYSSSTTKSRYTTALVSWSDPGNAYADAMEPVFEQALVARYGFNQLEMTAIGCTQAVRGEPKGRWGILTNNKDRVVSFDVGLDGNIPQPGYHRRGRHKLSERLWAAASAPLTVALSNLTA